MDATRYCKSFEDLYDRLNNQLSSKGLSIDKFQFPVSSLFLAWCGIKIEDAYYLLKRHIIKDRKVILYEAEKREVDVPEQAMNYLCDYKESTPGGENYYFLSPITSNRSSCKPILKSITLMNSMTVPQKSGFTYTRIYDSGVFYRALDKEKRIGGFPSFNRNLRLEEEGRKIYEDAFEQGFETAQSVTRVLKQYEEYKRIFYPEMFKGVVGSKQITEQEVETLKFLYSKAYSIKSISKITGRNEKSVRNALWKHGISNDPEIREKRQESKINGRSIEI